MKQRRKKQNEEVIPPRRSLLALAVFLALLVLPSYAQTVRYDFIYCDDQVFVTENPGVRAGLSADGVRGP